MDTVTGTGFDNGYDLSGVSNEETRILINDQAWSTQTICAFEGNCFYIGNLGADIGTKITVKQGFTITFNGVHYVTKEDYNFWWTGSAWVSSRETLTVNGVKIFSSANTLYYSINVDTLSGTGLSNWYSLAGYCNEETHILINDQAWSTQEICVFEDNCFYVNNINATVGTTITVKEGFTIVMGGMPYVAEEDYVFWWNGSNWVTEDFEAPEGIWKEMPLGVFGSPFPSQAAYDECADAGFNFVLIDQNYTGIDSAAYKAILNYCVQAGMNPITMTFNENDLTDFSSVPGFGGKFYYDECSAAVFPQIATYIDDFERVYDDRAVFLNNLYPSYVSLDALGTTGYEAYLESYITEVLSKVNGNKWLSVDFYPLLKNSSGSTMVQRNYLYNLEATAQAALNHRDMDLTVHYFVQTHGMGTDEWSCRDLSSVADIRYQYNCAMAYGVNAFSVFTYPSQAGEHFENGQGLVINNADGTTTKTAAYYYVQQANNELKLWDEIYLSYNYQGTKAIAVSANGWNMASMLRHNMTSLSGVRVSATNDTLVGQFDKDGAKAYMVTNYTDPSLTRSDTVTMTFENASAVQVYINGQMEEIALTNNQLVLNLGAGEAAFVVVK